MLKLLRDIDQLPVGNWARKWGMRGTTCQMQHDVETMLLPKPGPLLELPS